MIRLCGISKRYGDIIALHPTDLEFATGKTTVLLGPSGCGKSTILRLIVGLIEPTTGYVEIGGKRLTQENLLKLRRRMGYVIQDGGLFPHLSAEQNITLMARHLKRPSRWIQERLEALCTLTHFPRDALKRYPVELSGGKRQRVSLMRALFLDPDVLLLDEPLGALDAIVRASLLADLRDIFRRLQKTVVFVTHDLLEAVYLADEVVLMRDGRIIQKGTMDDLRHHPSDPFVTEFLNAQKGLVAL